VSAKLELEDIRSLAIKEIIDIELIGKVIEEAIYSDPVMLPNDH
jgi:hypothetical protein